MEYELVRFGGLIDWQLLDRKLGDMHTDGPGQQPLPTRLMAGLAILKHAFSAAGGLYIDYTEELYMMRGFRPYM